MTTTYRISTLIREYRGLLLFLALMLVFRSAVADWNDVPSSSMHPTIVEGDRILVNRLAYDLKLPFSSVALARLGEPERGDIVVFNSQAANLRLIKRVIGLPGDTVAMIGNRITVNGVAADYDAIQTLDTGWTAVEVLGPTRHGVRFADRAGSSASFAPVTVPVDHYLVLGDYRDNSADSRVYGFVPRSEISGRAERIVFSLDHERWRPRGDRFLRSLHQL